MGVKEINKEVPSLSKEYIKNLKWFQENRTKLSKYEGNWILICDSEVVAFSPNPDDISNLIKDKKLDINNCFLHFLVNANCIF